MARICGQCGRTFADSQAFCTDDGLALPEPVAVGTMGTMAAIVHGMPTANGGPATSPLGGQAAAAMFVEPQMDALTPGTQVGEYLVEEQIGEGGMGVIFSARHPIIGKRVALKVLNPDMAANVSIVQRFIQEARSVNQIGHRNIVDIFSFGRLSDGRHYFVMEYLDGMPLSKRITQQVGWQEAVAIWLQMLSAVEAAHKHGIIHRDLKPDNVFITPGPDGPFVKVLDFGIAKLLGETSVQKTGTGVPMGTPLYMSPEQTRGENVDHRTDLYAIGCIFYETIVGVTPFNAPSYFEVMSKQLTEPPPPFGERAQVNPSLASLVFALLEKDAGARPQTMELVRNELIRLRDLAIQHNQPLFLRGDTPIPGPSTPTIKAGPDEATVPWRPAVDGGFTVPEARDSGEMRAIAGIKRPSGAQPAAGAGRVGLYVGGALLATAAIGAVGFMINKKDPVPVPQVVIREPERPIAKAGRIKLVSTESGVTMFLDGKQVAEGGPVLEVTTSPGRHEIKVTKLGSLAYSTQVVVAAGETTDQIVRLEPTPVAPVVKPASTGGKKTAKAGPVAAPGGEPVPRTKDSTIDPFK